MSAQLRQRGWLVPAYTFPENREDLTVLRVVVRNGFSRDLAEILLTDVRRTVERLEERGGSAEDRPSFHH